MKGICAKTWWHPEDPGLVVLLALHQTGRGFEKE